MKIIATTVLAFAAITFVSAADNGAISYYDKTPCTNVRMGVVQDVSILNQTCATLKAGLSVAFGGSASCVDVSKVNPNVTSTYMSLDCITDTAESWAKKSFSGNYLGFGTYLDDKCTVATMSIFIAADGACSMAGLGGPGSYKVTVNSDGSVKYDTYTNLNCSGTPQSLPIKSSELAGCTGASGTYMKFFLSGSAFRNTAAFGSALIMALFLALF